MMVRSGIIIPFQFRDCKKLLMIGVPEENRDLNIWDLKNVVRAAFGIYNFEFRNKKIGFNIPDELLLHYLAQRRDLTNFVIEIGLIYEPNRDNYAPHASSTNCMNCHCVPTKIFESTSLNEERSLANQSMNSQNLEEPPLKLRIASSRSTPPSPTETSHIEIEPKIDYDTVASPTIADDDSQSYTKTSPFTKDEPQLQQPPSQIQQQPPPPPQHHQQQQPQPPSTQHQHPPPHILHQQDMQFERLQHEFYLQQQHIEAMMQETQTNNLRQRKERMSKKQKEVYVNFLEHNPQINEHRRNEPCMDRYWIKLAEILNSVPQGAVKHVAEWKQTFDNWRYRVFLYARYNSKIMGQDALNPKNFKPLTQTDKRAYQIWIRNPDTAPPDLDKMRNVFMNLEETQQE